MAGTKYILSERVRLSPISILLLIPYGGSRASSSKILPKDPDTGTEFTLDSVEHIEKFRCFWCKALKALLSSL
jgi:hypothetical protein